MNYIITGFDAYLIEKKVESLKENSLKYYPDTEVVYFDWSKGALKELLSISEQISLFSSKRFIIVKDADLNPLENKNNGLSEDEQALLTKYLTNPNPDTEICFICLSLNRKYKFTKSLIKLVEFNEIHSLDQNEFESFVRNDIKKNKLNISSSAVNLLIKRLPNDLTNWQSEKEKLINYPDEINEEVVNQLVCKPLFGLGEMDSLNFVNAILSKDLKKTMRYWNDLSQLTKDYYSLIGLTASQLRFLYKVKYLNKYYNMYEIADILNAKPYRIEKTLENTSKYSLGQILDLMKDLSDLDINIKSGKINDKLGFELFLMKSAGNLDIKP